jgi:hypothetical protein
MSTASLTEPPRPDPPAPDEDLLVSDYGTRRHGWRGYRSGRVTDPLFDLRLAVSRGFRAFAREAAKMPGRRVHIASVDVPARRQDLETVLRSLKDTRHEVTVSLAPLGDRGKFHNINLALRDADLSSVDWLIVVDDDIAFPPRFLDRFLCACEAASLSIAQPAHRFRSYTTWELTQRVWNSLVHTTHFVECGPLTAFHRSVFEHVLPFPETRWAWGLDVLWGEIARREGFLVGVVDATPIRHLRPVAQLYSHEAAIEEARQLLERHGVRRSNRAILTTTAVLSRL